MYILISCHMLKVKIKLSSVVSFLNITLSFLTFVAETRFKNIYIIYTPTLHSYIYVIRVVTSSMTS